jgi:hypothetical protein
VGGARGAAARFLRRGVRLKRPAFEVKVDPVFDPYRDEPRFAALLRWMNLAK